MIRYLKYIDWTLLVFNMVILLLFLEGNNIININLTTAMLPKVPIFYYWMYGYPIVWLVLLCINRYYKVRCSVVQEVNAVFFIISLFFLWLSLTFEFPRFG
ncbi:MAG: hypothetical protein LC109_13890 [Bacteroidia bacterium]|nr:hypothetical protein [Bacteroidia bacterium]